jgi:hypothetical protein
MTLMGQIRRGALSVGTTACPPTGSRLYGLDGKLPETSRLADGGFRCAQPTLQFWKGRAISLHLKLKLIGTTKDNSLVKILSGGFGIGWARTSMSSVS